MEEIEQAAERFRQWRLRCVAGVDDGVFEHPLNAETREGRARGKDPLLGIAHQNGSQRPECHLMRLEKPEAGAEGKTKRSRHLPSGIFAARRAYSEDSSS